MGNTSLFVSAGLLIAATAVAEVAADSPTQQEGSPEGLVIREVRIDAGDIFDLSDPRENKRLFRLANRLHVVTRDDVIRQQVLLTPGDAFEQRLAEESERILRSNDYLFDASITPTLTDDGQVDVIVATRDGWSLWPVLNFSRSGGENETSFGLEEFNLLGRGQTLMIERVEDVDRESSVFEFQDRQLGSSWIGADVHIANNSDGHTRYGSLLRPFFSLDTRFSAGLTVLDDDRIESFYALGDRVARYGHESRHYSGWVGWSAGLQRGWVTRYTLGYTVDDNRFSPDIDGDLLSIVPADRNLRYPFVTVEVLQDRFDKTKNREQIARTEDFYMGTRLTASVGWSDTRFGADRDALVLSAGFSRGFGAIDDEALLVSARAGGRREEGEMRNALIRADARYFRQQSEKRVLFASVRGSAGDNLDADSFFELGGDSGLRGYPLRYQAGDARMLVTLEQRYFWDWYPWRLFRFGGAIFADIGRTWGPNPAEAENLGWLRDIGIGLRLASPRTGVRKIVHIDLAFPLDGDASIDEVQLLIEAKQSF